MAQALLTPHLITALGHNIVGLAEHLDGVQLGVRLAPALVHHRGGTRAQHHTRQLVVVCGVSREEGYAQLRAFKGVNLGNLLFLLLLLEVDCAG